LTANGERDPAGSLHFQHSMQRGDSLSDSWIAELICDQRVHRSDELARITDQITAGT